MTQDEVDWIYNALDVCVTHEVRDRQVKTIDLVAANTSAFSHSLMAPIFEMTLRGTRIDLAKRDQILTLFKSRRAAIATNLVAIVEDGIGFKPFNYRSPTQLKQLFYGVMGFKPIKARDARGQYTPTVNRDALERLQDNWSAQCLCLHLLALRDLDKKVQFLETELDSDGRMRTSYNIAGTNTGRLSSSISDYGTGTNQQNIERELREVFIPDPGYKFCNIDLEQADSRNVGAICWNLFKDDTYLKACESGDLHTTVCRMAWPDLPWPEDRAGWRAIADQKAYRTMTYRDLAKRLGHGTNYLGTPRTMAKHSKVEIRLIEEFQAQYFKAFPAIRLWHEWVAQQIKQFGYITTPGFGRRRYFFGRPDDAATIREAVAYAPQSMTADTIDLGIRRLWREFQSAQLLIQVHDSILFQYPENLESQIVPVALDLLKVEIDLRDGKKFHVPVEAKVGWNWGDVHPNNPSGLTKWKGPNTDQRPRPVVSARWQLKDALNGPAR